MPQPSGWGKQRKQLIKRRGNTIFYHVWFSPKRRKWLLQGDVEQAVKNCLLTVAEEKGIRVLACATVVDHVHLLVEVGPEENLSKAVNLLKGVTARQIFLLMPHLKLDAGINHFWQKRYGYKEVPQEGVNRVKEYINTQWDRLAKFDR